jgi:hypothetical protein
MKPGRRGRVDVEETSASESCLVNAQVSASKHGFLQGKLRRWRRLAVI